MVRNPLLLEERSKNAHSLEVLLVLKTRQPQMPLQKRKKTGNPLKKELSNPQGLDFANQAGALMAQPQKAEMMPPKDVTKEAAHPEKTTSGVKNQSMKHYEQRQMYLILQCKEEEALPLNMKVRTEIQGSMKQKWYIQ